MNAPSFSPQRFLLLTCALIFLSSCAPVAVHVHDRHVESYQPIMEYAKNHPGMTLVLLDYHHDIAVRNTTVTSFNWVGWLVNSGLVSKVVWVSGRDLLLPNRNSRIAWLERALGPMPPSEAGPIRERIILADWSDLESLRLTGPLAVSLDLDVLKVDPGPSAEVFLDELSGWIIANKPGILSVALSAAYQREPGQAWDWMERFIRLYPEQGTRWYLEAGQPTRLPEGLDEKGAWLSWTARPDFFQACRAGFYPGSAQWINAPLGVRQALLEKKAVGADRTAREILSGWTDPDRLALEAEYPEERLQNLALAAREAIEVSWNGSSTQNLWPAPGESSPADRGLAVRLINRGVDRGCLSLYRGVSDPVAAARHCAVQALSDPRYLPIRQDEEKNLELEISIFGPWRAMNDVKDFRLGQDSLLVESAGSTTLLQASLARERGYSREQFLATLSKKAGLGIDGWKENGLLFYRSATLTYRRPLRAIGHITDGEER